MDSTKSVLPGLELACSSPSWECKQKELCVSVHTDTLHGILFPSQLQARHKAATFLLLASISLLSSSTLYCSAAVIKLHFHLLWLLQPLPPQQGMGNLRQIHGGNCPHHDDPVSEEADYCHCPQSTWRSCARSMVFTLKSHQ